MVMLVHTDLGKVQYGSLYTRSNPVKCEHVVDSIILTWKFHNCVQTSLWFIWGVILWYEYHTKIQNYVMIFLYNFPSKTKKIIFHGFKNHRIIPRSNFLSQFISYIENSFDNSCLTPVWSKETRGGLSSGRELVICQQLSCRTHKSTTTGNTSVHKEKFFCIFECNFDISIFWN